MICIQQTLSYKIKKKNLKIYQSFRQTIWDKDSNS
jgi:hypothetical protein